MSVPITVLMSVYNGERWLGESISSILSQTFTDFEFLIVNDGSSDSSPQIIRSFAANDQRIRIIDKPNTGLADSLNQGIQQARGEWVARIDADDLSKPKRLEVQYALAQSDQSLVLIGTGTVIIDVIGQCLKTYRYSRNHMDLVDDLLKKRKFFAHSSAFYRTQVVKQLGGYRPRIKRAQDYDLWLRLSEVGKLTCIEEPLVCIRKHSGQISHEECGRRQLVDSRVALVSHYLRQKGYADPVVFKSYDDNFDAFWSFIERGIDRNGLIEYKCFIEQIKAKLSSPTIAAVLTFLVLSLRSPHFVLRYFKEVIFGEGFARRLATDWINEDTTCAE